MEKKKIKHRVINSKNQNKWVKKISDSILYKLACIQLKREGKLETFRKSSKSTIYLVNPEEVILKGLEIVNKAHQRKIDL